MPQFSSQFGGNLSPNVKKDEANRDLKSQINKQRSFGDIITPQKMEKETTQDILGFSVNFT